MTATGGQRDIATDSRASLTLGRAPNCEIIIDQAHLSRQSAEIFTNRGKVFVRDLGTANGIFVNSELMRLVVELRDNDTIICGQPVAVYQKLTT